MNDLFAKVLFYDKPGENVNHVCWETEMGYWNRGWSSMEMMLDADMEMFQITIGGTTQNTNGSILMGE